MKDIQRNEVNSHKSKKFRIGVKTWLQYAKKIAKTHYAQVLRTEFKPKIHQKLQTVRFLVDWRTNYLKMQSTL